MIINHCPALDVIQHLKSTYNCKGYKFYLNPSVWVEIVFRNQNCVLLSGIACFDRGQGLGSAALKSICQTADKFNCGIVLLIDPFMVYGQGILLNKHQLQIWYERNGFKKDERFGMYTFYRSPKMRLDKINLNYI